MKRYLFIGSVAYSAGCLEAMLKMEMNIAGIMCPEKSVCAFNSDYTDLGPVAAAYGKDVYYFGRIADEREYIYSRKADIIFVLGLSQIIPQEILRAAAIGCIGSHPALLPQNRGRHPIVWALVNGLKKSGVTLFWINERVDSGDIWAQREFVITEEDNAQSIYTKATELTVDILKQKIPELERDVIYRTAQDHTQANYWRKRTEQDGEIDWRMSSERIHNLVRGLSRPYPGAHCVVQGKKCPVWQTRILPSDVQLSNIEPGKIIAVQGRKLTVKTGDGLIELCEHNLADIPQPGEYL